MGLAARHGLQLVMGLGQRAHQLLSRVFKGLACRRQAYRAAAGLDQRRARPGFKRTNAPTKGGVGDMAQLCRTGKAALLGQEQKVFQPFALHGQRPP